MRPSGELMHHCIVAIPSRTIHTVHVPPPVRFVHLLLSQQAATIAAKRSSAAATDTPTMRPRDGLLLEGGELGEGGGGGERD